MIFNAICSLVLNGGVEGKGCLLCGLNKLDLMYSLVSFRYAGRQSLLPLARANLAVSHCLQSLC